MNYIEVYINYCKITINEITKDEDVFLFKFQFNVIKITQQSIIKEYGYLYSHSICRCINCYEIKTAHKK